MDEKLRGSGGSNSRFGTTITGVGDLDLDGFNDVAIGAPFEDDGQGSVYIFRGHKEGVYPEFSQRISAANVWPNLRGFGWSISKSMDVDNNQYPGKGIKVF